MPQSRFLLAALASAVILTPLAAGAQWKTPWSYDGARGPDHWSELDPDYAICNRGKAQSPIDIEGAAKAKLPPLSFRYRAGPLNIINNGYTAVRVDYALGNGNVLIVGGKSYELTQFHFHRPSEEEIGGKRFDMVVHLMHQAADGSVAGVAIPLKAGKANAAVESLWAQMPSHAGTYHVVPGVSIDPGGLIPADTGYYTYEGSVTAPPCTEHVTWFVLKTPMEVSAEEIARFAALYPHDVRPLQPLNGRVVRVSE